MYYRRKVILALLQVFGGKVGKISFQKLLFLFTRSQKKPSFDFVPYHYGCYSFQSTLDMRTMIKYSQILEEQDYWLLSDTNNYVDQLTTPDKGHLKFIKRLYNSESTDKLLRYTYLNYPYYAIKSKILDSILGEDEINQVKEFIPRRTDTTLYTIGYEGISIEAYFNKLILHDVRVLCDVRKNPISMKRGFSKNELKKTCESLGLQYIHIPDLGIDALERKNLTSESDYKVLFDRYQLLTLTKNSTLIDELLEMLVLNQRIALTCFEAHYCQCHRSRLVNAITMLPAWKFNVKHL